MSRLKRFQSNPVNLLNTALHMYRSKKIKTAVVEGDCDKRFLSQWVKNDAEIRFDGGDGKRLVEIVFEKSQQKPYNEWDFIYLFADIDYDVVTKRRLIDHPRFIYNAYCFDQAKAIYNDLEVFLINTRALEKVLANLDVDPRSANGIRGKLEKASRELGCIRAADQILKIRMQLSNSILNGLSIREFFDASQITIDMMGLRQALPRWSNYPEYIDDLLDLADQLERDTATPWALTRGHDATEMLALHLEAGGQRTLTRERLELLLRLACEIDAYRDSPMGKRLRSGGETDCFIAF